MQKLFWANGIIKKLSRVQKQLPATPPRAKGEIAILKCGIVKKGNQQSPCWGFQQELTFKIRSAYS